MKESDIAQILERYKYVLQWFQMIDLNLLMNITGDFSR